MMKKILSFGLVLIISLGFSITYVKGMTYAEEGGKVIDRVCTMKIDKASAKTLTKDGQTFYFCSKDCQSTFAKNPSKYACICSQLHEGCNCGHCYGKGVPCQCAEADAESHAEKEGGGHEHEGHGH